MEQKIRELALFIAKFRICYSLFDNGKYTIDMWNEETEDREEVEQDDIYTEDK